MPERKFLARFASKRMFSSGPPEGAPLGGTRAEAVQRLQIGLFGIGAMILLVGLANVIGTQADMAQQAAVPDAAPTTEPTAAPAQSDPMVDAGIVPDIPAEDAVPPASGEAQPGDDDLP